MCLHRFLVEDRFVMRDPVPQAADSGHAVGQIHDLHSRRRMREARMNALRPQQALEPLRQQMLPEPEGQPCDNMMGRKRRASQPAFLIGHLDEIAAISIVEDSEEGGVFKPSFPNSLEQSIVERISTNDFSEVNDTIEGLAKGSIPEINRERQTLVFRRCGQVAQKPFALKRPDQERKDLPVRERD